jgi:AcrR family transcriptional regulator
MSSRKDELLDAAIAYVVETGVADLSLRPMAEALGTSARILLFHFGSKEGLLQAVFTAMQARLRASFAAMAATPSDVVPLKRFWQWAIAKQNAPVLRTLYELQVIAVQNPDEYGRYLAQASVDWQQAALRALSPALRSGPMATLCIAVFDGLFLEFMSTGERARLTRALDHFIALAQRSAE